MASVANISVIKVDGGNLTNTADVLAVEEPLEIRLEYGPKANRISKVISVTMRTPGADEELATGFLFTEGVILTHADIDHINKCKPGNDNVICVSLTEQAVPVVSKIDRNFYTTSSCGVCGKASIEAVRTACNVPDTFDNFRFPASLLVTLPDALRKSQDVFQRTGGLHACALFDTDGQIVMLREDVGRHNALDKLIGAALQRQIAPLDNYILLLSGRASFELVQKAIMAGVKVVAAVGAPSSLAAEMAEEWGMTLIGFLRGDRFNIYSGAERIVI